MMRTRLRSLAGLLLGMAFCLVGLGLMTQISAKETDHGIARRNLIMIDKTRPIVASGKFPGTPDRRIDLMVWYPAAPGSATDGEASPARGGPWPLVLYAHGTLGYPDNAMHIVRDLVRHGYVVAAPTFPLSSSKSFTGIAEVDLSDVVNQTGDLAFVIDRLLADDFFGPLIDKDRIGSMGHSLGAVTNYFAAFGSTTRVPRIGAVALLGAGDPVQAALSNDMGFNGSWTMPTHVPALFLSAEKDVFSRMTGGHHAAYWRLAAPRYEVLIKGGTHVWFRDSTDHPADNKNPDCAFFERTMPGVPIPGCEERVPLIGPALQQQITRTALRAFFDAYLKDNKAAHQHLLGLDIEFPEKILMTHEELPAEDSE